MRFFRNTATLTQEQASARFHCTQQVHNQRSIWTTNSKVYHCDAVSSNSTHIRGRFFYRHTAQLTKQIHIMIEIGQKDMLSKIFQRQTSITLEPITHDFFTRLHINSFYTHFRRYTKSVNPPKYLILQYIY